jgi:hypothetical protein
MTKQQSMFPMKTGGGLLSKIVWLVVVLAVLMLIIHNPSEAAGWASGLFHLGGQIVNGLAAFLRNLFG